MLKLLLSEKRKEIRSEYFKRYFSLVFAMLSIVLILFGASLVPTYILLRSEAVLLEDQIRISKDPEISKERVQLRNTLSDLDDTIASLDIKRYQIAEIIERITRNQLRSVSIASIAFDQGEETIDTIQGSVLIQGSATNRESLVNFVSNLETIEFFQSVDIPFSSFARNEDIPFSITIILNPISTTNVESSNS